MSRNRVVSRRTRQQLQEVVGGALNLVKTIFINGVMVMLLPVLAPISLAVQLWNSLPSFRQVRNAIPRSFGDLCRIPSAIWNSIPSLNQLLNMLVNLIRAMVRDYTTRLSPQVTGQSTRQPAL